MRSITAVVVLIAASLVAVVFWNNAKAQVPEPLPGLPPVELPQPKPILSSEYVPRSETPKPATPPVVVTLDQPMPGPVGAWEREIATSKLSLRIEMRSLVGTLVLNGKDRRLTYELRADYATTKDSILYGVVTSASMAGEKKEPEVEKLEMALQRQLTDWPFSLRFRVDGDTLTIKGVRFAFPAEIKDFNEVADHLLGSYKRTRPAAASAFARPAPAE